MLAGTTALHQRSQFADRLRPQRAPAGLVPFAPNQDRGRIAVRYLGQRQVADLDLGRFVGPSAGIVQEQEQCMIPTALSGRHVRRCEHGIHLRLFQVRDQRFRGLLERYRPHLSAPFDQLRSVQPDEPGQRVNRGQTLIASGNSASAILFQVAQELSYAVGRHVDHV